MMVQGFEKPPKGRLLSQLVDFGDGLGAAYERCIGYDKDFHAHDRLNLTFPRGSSVIAFTTETPRARFVVDETSFLWMPAGVTHRQDAISTIYDNLALFPTETEARRIAGAVRAPDRTVKGPRTRLLDELVQRYFYERVLCSRRAEDLARAIVAEALRALTQKACREPSSLDTDDTIVGRALRYVETNLFGNVATGPLAEYAGASPATLFRHFRDATGMTPREYVRGRRLDEARHLLRTGDYSVTDVAFLVGYEDLPSFSKAFRKRFGASPSEARVARHRAD